MRVIKPALIYFACVFGAGFLLGPLRVLFLVPRIGTRGAELAEMPLMGTVIWFAAGWIVRRFCDDQNAMTRLVTGFSTISLVLAADIVVGMTLRRLSFTEVITSRDIVSGAAYYGLLIVCALLPWLRDRH